MVAMVAMTREPPQRPREPRPVREDAACRRCGARDAPSARGTGTLEHGRRAAMPDLHPTAPSKFQLGVAMVAMVAIAVRVHRERLPVAETLSAGACGGVAATRA